MKHILLIATGGTIACQPAANGLAPALSAEELAGRLMNLPADCVLESVQACSIDSTDISISIWQAVAGIIREQYSRFDGFVITHGTDTLAYTAAALSYMFQNSFKPIILTGAQKSITSTGTDAIENLQDSLAYACFHDAHDVCVVFGKAVIAGTRARKMFTKSVRAFESINFPVLAELRDGKILPSQLPDGVSRPLYQENALPQYQPAFDSSLFILKLMPGMDPEIIPELFARYRCIILEGFGMGGIPENLMPAVTAAAGRYPGRILAAATQAAFEGTNIKQYAVGRRLSAVEHKCHVIELCDMTIEAAAVKLMWLMGNPDCVIEDIASRFYHPVNYDICTFPVTS